MRINLDEIGGGKVIRGFNAGGERVNAGTLLTREFLAAIPANNRNTLIDKNFIQVWPKAAAAVSPPDVGAGPTAERHVVALGFGRYNVIEGTVLNASALTREQAHKLAGKPMPDKEEKKRA